MSGGWWSCLVFARCEAKVIALLAKAGRDSCVQFCHLMPPIPVARGA